MWILFETFSKILSNRVCNNSYHFILDSFAFVARIFWLRNEMFFEQRVAICQETMDSDEITFIRCLLFCKLHLIISVPAQSNLLLLYSTTRHPRYEVILLYFLGHFQLPLYSFVYQSPFQHLQVGLSPKQHGLKIFVIYSGLVAI